MKKLSLFMTCALALALIAGTTGCQHRPTNVTPIPSTQPPQSSQNVGPGITVPSDTNGVTGIAQTEGGPWAKVLNDGAEDRDKFKADAVYFDFDSATIKPSEESKLQDVYNYFKGNTTDALKVEGNCDERGTEKYNLALGDRRALAIREYLVNLGMDPSRIKTLTWGAAKPVDSGHNEDAWKKNRRGDLVLMQPK